MGVCDPCAVPPNCDLQIQSCCYDVALGPDLPARSRRFFLNMSCHLYLTDYFSMGYHLHKTQRSRAGSGPEVDWRDGDARGIKRGLP